MSAAGITCDECWSLAVKDGYCGRHHPDYKRTREDVQRAAAALLDAAKRYCETKSGVDYGSVAETALHEAYDTLRAAESKLAALTTETTDNG